jgi:hypothetical protein
MKGKIVTVLGLALGLMACSDLGVEKNEAIGMPADFSLEEYIKINPDVKYQQIRKDLMDHGYYNKARLDTAKKAVMMPDSTIVVDYVDFPSGAKLAKDARKAAQANIDADNEEFLTDTALVHKVFSLYVGFADSLWAGVDSLDSDEKTAILEFNKQQTGKPSVKEDKEYLEKFAFDEDLMFNHYLLLGVLEGRAYRYCKKGESKSMPIEKVVPDTLGTKPFMLDYSAGRFCYDSTSAQKYLIQ